MSRHVFRKGIAYFKRNGFKKACRRTVYFFTERNSYNKLMKHTQASKAELERQRNERFAYEPKISILIPMYNTPVKFFRELIECVQAQTYSNWELCLADGTGKETESSAYAVECSRLDKRIVYKMLDSNDGISENTNRALEMATGEFIALMDHDDIITEDALYYLVKAVNDNPDADSVYSDEDKMDMDGNKYFEPNFKPDFNIDLLRNCNYICHMFMTRTRIAKEIGGFRKAFDGAQDFDFIFRCIEKSRFVAHVPRVIYHWRCHINSTAAVPESKMYAYNAGVNSIKEHFERTGIKMTARMGASFGYYRNDYIITGQPLVSVIIYGDPVRINVCKKTILEQLSYDNVEAITCEDTAKAINEAVAKSTGKYLLMLDTRITNVTADTIELLLGYVQRDDVVLACAKTIGRDERVYHSFLVMGIQKSFGYAFRQLEQDTTGYFMRNVAPQDVSGADFTCTLIDADMFRELGGLDESLNVVYAAADFSLMAGRLRKERMQDAANSMVQDMCKIVFVPYAVARIDAYSEEKWKKDEYEKAICKKWPELVKKTDSYYNTNLTKKDTSFTILSSMEIKAQDL